MLVERAGQTSASLEALRGAAVATIEGSVYEKLLSGIPDVQLLHAQTQKGSPLRDSLSEHIKRLKSSRIYFRLLERHLGSRAVEIIQTARQD